MDVYENIVVGAGPTGVATTAALLSQGRRVLVLDAGRDLEPEIKGQVERLRDKSPTEWQPSDLRFLKDRLRATASGFDLKLSYGSDFCYRWDDARTDFVSLQRPPISPSFAVGGLSRAWGAGALPFSVADLEGWPIAYGDLASLFPAVKKLIPYAATSDDLTKLHPLSGDLASPLQLSEPARRFLSDATTNPRVASAGITVGSSRLAVESGPCVYCGLCLYGCPYGLIWNATDTLGRLTAAYRSLLEYRSGWIVDSVREVAEQVELTCHHRDMAGQRTFRAARVFLAAGVIQSTKIMLRSLGRYDEPVILRDSQYFVFPFLRWKGTAVLKESVHTLAQLFLELRDPYVCAKPVLLSIYSYNDQMLKVIQEAIPFLGPGAAPVARALAGRLLVFGGYLHSDYSSTLRLVLERDGDGRDRLVLSHEINPLAAAIAQRAVRALARLWRPLRGVPVLPMLRVKDPGTAYHFGGSFPMTSRPLRNFESDRLGRPRGFSRVFLTDASNFPTIPASTITFNAMANAYRIALASTRGNPV